MNNMTEKPCCENCIFCFRLDTSKDNTGLCRYNPPVPVIMKDQLKSVYPKVDLEAFCSKFTKSVPENLVQY